ncbi:MAG: anthranilate synthase component I [Gammaproteobacteria bacterium]|nr:anthranilate synthase component I [Gammaproteobacteria bacterium]
MNQDDFDRLAASGYNRIPVVREVAADLETPLSTYLKLADGPYSYLLESAQGGERWGRYSIIGLPCDTVIRVAGDTVTVETGGKTIESAQTDDPLAFIEAYQGRFRVPRGESASAELPRFIGGLVGYFGYDTVRYTETRLAHSTPPDPMQTPDILLMVSNDVIVFDNLRSRMQLITLVDPAIPEAYAKAMARLGALASNLAAPVPPIPETTTFQPPVEDDFVSEFGRENFMRAVERIREYILAGDVMQVVLAQRMSIPFNAAPINLYRALRSLNPSPYMYFMHLGDFQIVSSSPEILARVEDGTIVNRPLAGTRRRGHTREEDLALEAELLSDPKEISEHLMLIDLGRNDVGRVAETGSVKVTEQFVIERYSHVMHISSNVEGRLRAGKTAMDVLRAALPVGTLSGAPKIRAMEIIDELEPVKRGIYGGAVGYLSWNGNMDTAIAIRTAVVKDGTLYIEAGGGIVADALPHLEWKESMNKGRAIFRAAEMAERRLDQND